LKTATIIISERITHRDTLGFQRIEKGPVTPLPVDNPCSGWKCCLRLSSNSGGHLAVMQENFNPCHRIPHPVQPLNSRNRGKDHADIILMKAGIKDANQFKGPHARSRP
jgi:hypothetical protein